MQGGCVALLHVRRRFLQHLDESSLQGRRFRQALARCALHPHMDEGGQRSIVAGDS